MYNQNVKTGKRENFENSKRRDSSHLKASASRALKCSGLLSRYLVGQRKAGPYIQSTGRKKLPTKNTIPGEFSIKIEGEIASFQKKAAIRLAL